MRTLVLGGIRSGKSRWAESALADRVQQSAPADRVHSSAPAAPPAVRYLATGGRTPADEEWTRRVARHRERRPQHWHTVESDAVAAELRDDPHTPTLVDDIGGWLTATLDRLGWDGRPADGEIDDLVSAVEGFAASLVLVSPEVGLTVVPASAAGRRFADDLGTVNQRLAACCDEVVLVVAGQPLTLKSARES